jgi:NAD(P)H-dependent FMN reductase
MKSQIQSLKLSQKDNQESIHKERTVNVLGVAGSMREQSYSTRVLKMILEEVKKYDSESYMLELRKINLPLYDPSEITSSDESSSNANNSNKVLERITAALKITMALCLAE